MGLGEMTSQFVGYWKDSDSPDDGEINNIKQAKVMDVYTCYSWQIVVF